MKKSYKSSNTTMKDIYLQYPYKTYDTSSSTIPVPYFSKDEISDHKWSLTYKEWKAVIVVYLKNLVLHIMSGKSFEFPSGLGKIQLMKYKPVGEKLDYTKPHKDSYLRHDNRHTNGYCPIVIWDRLDARLANKWLWRFKLNRKVWKMISDKLMSEPSLINQWHEVQRNPSHNQKIKI